MKEKHRPINHYFLTEYKWEVVRLYKEYRYGLFTVTLEQGVSVYHNGTPINTTRIGYMVELLQLISKHISTISLTDHIKQIIP